MPEYSTELASDYTRLRDSFSATDSDLFAALESVGVKGRDILDFGCGDGVYALEILRRGAKSVTGIDISSSMIQLATARASQAHADVPFVIADGAHLPFADVTFDIVISNFVLQHFSDITVALREIARVLKPGGFLVCMFGAMLVKPGYESIYSSEIPLLLGSGERVRVLDYLGSAQQARESIQSLFQIIRFENLENPFAIVDPASEFTDKIARPESILCVAEKSSS